MGWNLNKTIDVGKKAKINLTKSGIGASLSTDKLKVSRTASGSTRVSLPNTGISWTGSTKKK